MMANFDRVARAYRWLEYLSFGRSLVRCREARLGEMLAARRALVVGDGDGRFTAALLSVNSGVEVVAVDSSRVMLTLLRDRAESLGAGARLRCVPGDALQVLGGHTSQQTQVDGEAPGGPLLRPAESFDLVVTHFFLDCLTSEEVGELAVLLRSRLRPQGRWVVSEFATPSPWAKLVVAGLYLAFGLMTGLPVRTLPEYDAELRKAAFVQEDEKRSLAGLLVSSVWRLH